MEGPEKGIAESTSVITKDGQLAMRLREVEKSETDDMGVVGGGG